MYVLKRKCTAQPNKNPDKAADFVPRFGDNKWAEFYQLTIKYK